MNTFFWALMVLMLLLAIALLVYPLLKVRQHSSLAYKDSNLKINEEKLNELDADLAEGRIDQASYKAARMELDRELLIDIPAESQQTAAQHYTSTAKRQPVTALMIAVFVPMLTFLIYLQLGMHAASEESFADSQQPSMQQQQAQQQAQQLLSVETMAQELEERITENGGTPEEWTMLARAHKYLGKNDLAAKAFSVALENDEKNAQLMLEAAEVIALNNKREFNAEARALVMKAYALEPQNANVLWFIGVAEFQQGNYRNAIEHLKDLLPMAGGEEDVMKSIVTIVAKSRQQLIDAGEEMPALEKLLGVPVMAEASVTPEVSSGVPSKVSSKAGDVQITKLTIDVDVSAAVREKFDDDDVVFVYAKAMQGPRMPLAAKRITLSSLPTTITLDDSMAMAEGMNLSAFEQ
jgi:cytochrome c-type biogenesis protein CcmH